MNKKTYFKEEWMSILKNKKVLIPMIAVMLIPLLYSFMFLWAFWDPYSKLSDLPVAVINQDQGANFEGKKLAVGQDFIDKLKESNDFKYEFVSKQEAQDGLENQKYYMAIEIPQDFSEKATKVMDDQPIAPEFKYIANESLNFLSSQIGQSAVEKMKTEIAHELTKAYADVIFDQVGELSDGLAQAADGAKNLADGSKQIEEGIAAVDMNLGKLSEGAAPLQAGVKGLYDGALKLNDGAVELNKGSAQLANGLDALHAGSQTLAGSGGQLQDAAKTLQSGLSSSVTGIEQLQAGASGLNAAVQNMIQAKPELAESKEFQQLLELAKQLDSGATSVLTGQKQLLAGAEKLSESQGQYAAGVKQLDQKIAEAAQGAKTVSAGTTSLLSGTAQMKDGLSQLSGGVEQIGHGSVQLKEGTLKLSEGMNAIVEGSNELSTKLSDAADKTGQLKPGDANSSMIADPVHLAGEGEGVVPNYGTGFTPYFLSLGLFVGALMLTIVYPMKQPVVRPKSSVRWFLGKLSVLIAVGTIQALLADWIILGGLKLEVQSVPLFIIMSLITSWCFMAILQFLVTAFHDVGRFIAIILLILQLTTSAGTFPLELIPDALQHFNAWVPMTYSVSGFKAVISSGQFNVMWNNAFVLGGVTLVMALLTWGALALSYKRHFGQHEVAAQ